MEKKISLRNKYINKIKFKLAEVKKCVNTLSQIDKALLNQTGGADGIVNLNTLKEAIKNIEPKNQEQINFLQNSIANKTLNINAGIESINNKLEELLGALVTSNIKLDGVFTNLDNIPIPYHDAEPAGFGAAPGAAPGAGAAAASAAGQA